MKDSLHIVGVFFGIVILVVLWVLLMPKAARKVNEKLDSQITIEHDVTDEATAVPF